MELRDATWVAAWHIGRAMRAAARMLCHCHWCRISARYGTRLWLIDALRYDLCEVVAWRAMGMGSVAHWEEMRRTWELPDGRRVTDQIMADLGVYFRDV